MHTCTRVQVVGELSAAAIYVGIISRALARDRDKSNFLVGRRGGSSGSRKRHREINAISGKVRNNVHLLAVHEAHEFQVSIFVAEKLPLSRSTRSSSRRKLPR